MSYVVGIVLDTQPYVMTGAETYAEALRAVCELAVQNDEEVENGAKPVYDDMVPLGTLGLSMEVEGEVRTAVQSWQIDDGEFLMLVGIIPTG